MDLERSLKHAGREIAGLFGSEREADILDTLKKEHDEVGHMLKRLVDSESATERRALVKKIKAALIPHMKAEQKVVYDAVIALRPKDAKTHGEEGYIEHKMAGETLLLLGKISNAGSPEFLAAAKVLKELVEHHVREEERDIWADVKEHFGADDRARMNRRFEQAKKRVRSAA
jgi:hypothetical protein